MYHTSWLAVNCATGPLGARAANLLIEQPTKSELVIDLKIAKTLGLTIPQSLLLPQGSEPRRPADRASNQVRVVRESQDRKSTRPQDPRCYCAPTK